MVNDAFDNDLARLKEDILKMGRLLEEQIIKSVKALTEKNIKLAEEVITKDDIIDQMELDIERKCLSLVALQQPMASDLRFLGTALRIIIDIERMGDHAEDIAEAAIDIYDQVFIKPLIDIPRMANVAEKMVEIALQAFIDNDVELAMTLVEMEAEMDALYDQVFRELLSYMMQDQKNIPQATDLLFVSGHLERIGDHATNLAEMVLYVVEGKRIDINVLARSK
ncbi:MAG: phosphate signaling complex protein PhoU [Bacillota bacterium]|nr:phosphate signaling complex protein PhoU [Bacillota bacterium]